MARGNPNPTHKFKKGQSGNPNGRPVGLQEFKTLCQEKSAKALEVVAQILESKTSSEANKLRAAEIILERSYGKAPQEIKGVQTDAYTRAWLRVVEKSGNVTPDGRVHLQGKTKGKA